MIVSNGCRRNRFVSKVLYGRFGWAATFARLRVQRESRRARPSLCIVRLELFGVLRRKFDRLARCRAATRRELLDQAIHRVDAGLGMCRIGMAMKRASFVFS